MGKTISSCSHIKVPNKTIFNNRFVVEVAELMHVHYRNLRINLTLYDWVEMCKGFAQAYNRWVKIGMPVPGDGKHTELCRKKVATDAVNAGIQVNLNENLYKQNEGRIFAEGAEFKDDHYVHVKTRDLRIEMPITEFMEFADAIQKAAKGIEDRYPRSVLQKT